MSEAFQTKRTIQATLMAAGLSPSKRFGQNFLIDRNLMRRLIESAAIGADDVVLEIGAGTGSLTAQLAEKAGAVVTVEIDRGLVAVLERDVLPAAGGKVELIARSILANKNRLEPAVLEAVARHHERLGGRAMLVANLPYDVASPVVIELAAGYPQISPLCFTVQKEVGQRMAAEPGDGSYGLMSVILQAVADVAVVTRVPPQAFWPAPKVESVMIRIDQSPVKRARVCEVDAFRKVVRTLFGHRRKTLRQNVRRSYAAIDVEALEAATGIDFGRRPETLSVDEWIVMMRRVGQFNRE